LGELFQKACMVRCAVITCVYNNGDISGRIRQSEYQNKYSKYTDFMHNSPTAGSGILAPRGRSSLRFGRD